MTDSPEDTREAGRRRPAGGRHAFFSPLQYAVLQPGQSYRQQTYVGHPWVVTDAQGTGLVCFLSANQTLRAVVR
ncbi:hypothetical protein OG799_26645 [Micromonospora sp. NBC_00898]|uniref:VHL beta domain-containing protein n=1 Tax=Micromonospora sp. NBC_00898 TaxID=2975981 RepID=UPI00386D208D|nr:hypothetical protein OG799_26645 [Micromonospora sp. NBC_00898]